MGKFNLLGGQNNLLGGQMPTQLTCYLPLYGTNFFCYMLELEL